jgi:hypothetical protein
MSQFKQNGYFIEYMVQGKYVGSINIEQPDREEVGYYGRIDAVATKDIVFNNKKRIKKGTQYYTRMYPLCGARDKNIY